VPWKTLSPEARYHRIGLVTLIAGLLAAAVVYRCTSPQEYASSLTVYRIEEGNAYPVDPGSLKKNQQDTWTKANLRTMEFLEWSGTWFHGRRLACTLAALSGAGFLVCLFLANFEFRLAPPQDPRERGDRDRG
jgi:hypothetical protein